MLLVMVSHLSVRCSPDERIMEAELVGQDDGLAVLAQRFRKVPVHRMHRHGEVPQSHSISPILAAVIPGRERSSRTRNP